MNLLVYWFWRGILQTFFWTYLRMRRTGMNHIPASGPAIIASNHRSFFDPFLIGMMTRRPMYYMAKRELFGYNPVLSWLLSALGAFPVDRGNGDQETIRTVKELLARGELVLIFPEGHRIRPGGLGSPRRGVGRLALETGAPVVPVAVIGTDEIRRGWRLRPRRVRCRAGAPLRFPMMPVASPQVAATVTGRVWQRISLQWEWLGGHAGDDQVPAAVAEPASRAA